MPESAFLKTCIHCGQCAAACPYGSVRMLKPSGRNATRRKSGRAKSLAGCA
ncbi:MAG: 4Fe-4S dicluster domain-containing protein [Bilophila wadsworthia]